MLYMKQHRRQESLVELPGFLVIYRKLPYLRYHVFFQKKGSEQAEEF